MTKRFNSKWWKCRRTGCDFDSHEAAKAAPMNCNTYGDFAAKIMQVHLLDHICEMLGQETRRDHELLKRALSAGERSASVAEALIAVSEAERIAAAATEHPTGRGPTASVHMQAAGEKGAPMD